jgi:hypothetical protein
MLKFSGYPYLIRGQPVKMGGLLASHHRASGRERKLLRVEPDGAATDFEARRRTGAAQHQAELEG